MENFVQILEFNKKTEFTMKWLFEILDEEKICYKKEIKEYWAGKRVPQYEQKVILYVAKEDKEKVEVYLKAYEEAKNIIVEAEELKNSIDEEESECKSAKICRKMLAYIPIIMVGIVIICGILSGILMG